jgi:hypothetical protein
MRPRWWQVIGLVLLAVLGVVGYGVFGGGARMAALSIVDIDGYPRQTEVKGCANPLVGKPGVVQFRSMILSQLGGGDDGLAACKEIANNSGEYSDHADGRAWDWHVSAANAADRGRVDRVLDWLLRTDDRGNRNAMARRIGITYIIWNHRYYRVGSDDAHWVPYTSTADPHDTHVHFSFSVAGALRQTSWWTERGPLVWTRSDRPADPIILGVGALRPLAGDWDGDGRDTFGAYNPATRTFSLWNSVTTTIPATTTPAVGPFGAIPFAGNWDGLGGDELGYYEPLARRFDFISLSGAVMRPAMVFGTTGDLPIIGDWDGDGKDDIGAYTPSSRTFTLRYPDGSVRTKVFGDPRDTPVIGDWNGDGRDDVGVFRSAIDAFWFDTRWADGHDTVTSVRYGAVRRLPVIGDWDGLGIDRAALVAAG